VAPRDGVLNVWIQDVKDGAPVGEPRPITASTKQPIRQWSFVPGFAKNAGQILYLQDRGGDENFQIFAVDVATGEEKLLTPWPGSRATIIATDKAHPHKVLVSVNNRDPAMFDAWMIDTRSGEGEMIFKNEAGWISMLPDRAWNIRIATRMTPDGALEAAIREEPDGAWKPFWSWPFEDASSSQPLAIADDGKSVFVVDSSRPVERNTGGLYQVSFAPKGEGQTWTLLATNPKAEPGSPLIDPATNRPQAVPFEHVREEWQVLDPAIEGSTREQPFACHFRAGDGSICHQFIELALPDAEIGGGVFGVEVRHHTV
jgi:hypothetical protein